VRTLHLALPQSAGDQTPCFETRRFPETDKRPVGHTAKCSPFEADRGPSSPLDLQRSRLLQAPGDVGPQPDRINQMLRN
jgi:hypothetical protein